MSSIRFPIRHVSTVPSSLRAVITVSTGGQSGSWQLSSATASVVVSGILKQSEIASFNRFRTSPLGLERSNKLIIQ